MKISDDYMLNAALLISQGCHERQGCELCALHTICSNKNRSKPPEEWNKLLKDGDAYK